MYRPTSGSVSGSNPLLDVDSTIRGLTQDFCMAYNTGNYDQGSALFASDGVLTLSHRESCQGSKAIERMLRQYRESGCRNLHFETMRVEHSGDMAIEMGRYTVSMEPGNIAVGDAGRFLRAWRRLGVWRIVGDSWTSTLPVDSHEITIGGGTKVA
jgi:ketosteroid isomerase-like protein